MNDDNEFKMFSPSYNAFSINGGIPQRCFVTASIRFPKLHPNKGCMFRGTCPGRFSGFKLMPILNIFVLFPAYPFSY